MVPFARLSQLAVVVVIALQSIAEPARAVGGLLAPAHPEHARVELAREVRQVPLVLRFNLLQASDLGLRDFLVLGMRKEVLGKVVEGTGVVPESDETRASPGGVVRSRALEDVALADDEERLAGDGEVDDFM